MGMMTVKPVHNWRGKVNEMGRYPIHLRLTLNRKHKYYPITVPLKVAESEWSGKDDMWVKNSHPYGFEINERIKLKKNIVSNTIKRFYNAQRTITFPAIFKELKKSGNTSCFNDYFAEYNKRPTDDVEPGTLKKYNACLDHLNDFNRKIAFTDLTPALIEEFHMYLKKTAKLKGSTMDSYFDAFKKIVGLARKEHFLSKDDAEEMFEDLHIDINKAKRTFLTIEEIKDWKNIKFTIEEMHLKRTRDLFLFQVYTGFYYKDLIGLKKEYLVKDHEVGYLILGERNKNDEQNIIPLFKFPEASKIIDAYGSKDANDPYVFRRDIFIEEPVYNRQLKEISPKANIAKSVSNKVARHSNVQLYIRLGTYKPVISKMVGHNREQTLDAYYRIDIVEVIEKTSHIDIKKLGI